MALRLLRENRNYRAVWLGQVVSEIGDHFNNIAVFALAMRYQNGGMVVAGVLIARAIPMLLAGPLAGVVLDRFDRKRIMIASDLIRFVIAILFIPISHTGQTWPLYVLSAILMAASPFFTSGRSAILPTVAAGAQLHTANAMTQTTGWATVALGAFLGGTSVHHFGYDASFLWNAASFLLSALAISRLRGDFRAPEARDDGSRVEPWRDYREGLAYLRRNPLLLCISLVGVGWATGGGAAQILFSLFGEKVFGRGPAGIGEIWGCAGIGLVVGGLFAHWLGKRLSFAAYKNTISIAYVVHGLTYVAFSLMTSYGWALVMIGLSRAAVAVSSVLNYSVMLRHVAGEYRGRVFATMETLTWSAMMVSLMFAGIASTNTDPRKIGVVAGLLSSTTAIFWGWANWTGRLPSPQEEKANELTYGTR
jgi:predicted MFS family arabinose efflux permease